MLLVYLVLVAFTCWICRLLQQQQTYILAVAIMHNALGFGEVKGETAVPNRGYLTQVKDVVSCREQLFENARMAADCQLGSSRCICRTAAAAAATAVSHSAS